MKPTYSAIEVRRMCTEMELDKEAFGALFDIVQDEIGAYSQEDLHILMEASFIFYIRTIVRTCLPDVEVIKRRK